MNPNSSTNVPSIKVSDRVSFTYCGQEYFGYVSRKGRTYAHVVCDNSQEFRISCQLLQKNSDTPGRYVPSHADTLRLRFKIDDAVSFEYQGRHIAGTIARLNPKRACILCEDEQEYHVPYQLLIPSPSARGGLENQDEMKLQAVVCKARELLLRHDLQQWSFQFDHGSKRAGCCRYDNQVISVSHEYARQASEEEIQDVLLHEIAHALVGKEHNHDAFWKARAVAIGGSGKRCHDKRFTPPRYIVKCTNNCWAATAERRRRDIVCKRCQGAILYLTFSEERWQKERQSAAFSEKQASS